MGNQNIIIIFVWESIRIISISGSFCIYFESSYTTAQWSKHTLRKGPQKWQGTAQYVGNISKILRASYSFSPRWGQQVLADPPKYFLVAEDGNALLIVLLG